MLFLSHHRSPSARAYFTHHNDISNKRRTSSRMQGCRSTYPPSPVSSLFRAIAFSAVLLFSNILPLALAYLLFKMISIRFLLVLFLSPIFLAGVHKLLGLDQLNTMGSHSCRCSSRSRCGTSTGTRGDKTDEREVKRAKPVYCSSPRYDDSTTSKPKKNGKPKEQNPGHPCSPATVRRLHFMRQQAIARKRRAIHLAHMKQRVLRELHQQQFSSSTVSGMSNHQQQHSSSTTVPMHVTEHDNKVELSIDVPGIKATDLQINVVDDNCRVLSISTGDDSDRSFSRRFEIDTTSIDVDNLSANLINGVLTITAPKIPVKKPTPAMRVEITTTTKSTTDSHAQPSDASADSHSSEETPDGHPEVVETPVRDDESSAADGEADRLDAVDQEETVFKPEIVVHGSSMENSDTIGAGTDADVSLSNDDDGNVESTDDEAVLVETPDDDSTGAVKL